MFCFCFLSIRSTAGATAVTQVGMWLHGLMIWTGLSLGFSMAPVFGRYSFPVLFHGQADGNILRHLEVMGLELKSELF